MLIRLFLTADKHDTLQNCDNGLNLTRYQGWIVDISSSGTCQEFRSGLGSTPPFSSGTRLESRTGWSTARTIPWLLPASDIGFGFTRNLPRVLIRVGQRYYVLIRNLPKPRTWWLASLVTSSLVNLTLCINISLTHFMTPWSGLGRHSPLRRECLSFLLILSSASL